jgi:large subunit ribosomal protein L35e
MAKTTKHAKEFRGKKNDELLGELKKLREELQKIRFTRSSGTAVSKLSKIKDLRKQIARILTVIRENKKLDVVKSLRERVSKKEGNEEKDKKEEEVKTTIKNLKMKHIPLDLRPKLTRAMRRRMTKFERKLVTLRQLKRKLNFPMRKFAVPTKQA